MTTSPGRNDRCPCGSGRKFKHCCLKAIDHEDAARIRLRSAEDAVVPALVEYVAQAFGPEFFGDAWNEFFLWDEVPNASDSPEFGTTFEPFLVFSFVPDEGERDLPQGWPSEPVGQHFLRHGGESVQDFHRELIEQACKSPASFFAVESVVPGRSIDIKDILTGRHFHVLEQSASQTLRAGDIAFTRVVTAGGASIMIGTSRWLIPPSWHVPIINFRERLRKRRLLTREELIDFDIEIREFYLDLADAVVHPRLPVLRNTDGDLLALTTLTYELSVTVGEAIVRLQPLATLNGETHISDEIFDASGAVTAAVLTWLKAGNRHHKEWDNTTLGTLRLEGSRLVVEVNSERRRARIVKEISKRLGDAATLIDTKVTDIAEELEARRRREKSGQVGVRLAPPTRTPEMEALEAELTRKHWDAWIDTKVPALGNRTPRQAARTAPGRERLEALLSDFARADERNDSHVRLDVDDLRQKLGLD